MSICQFTAYPAKTLANEETSCNVVYTRNINYIQFNEISKIK